jgi:hypothetical protein
LNRQADRNRGGGACEPQPRGGGFHGVDTTGEIGFPDRGRGT